MKASRIDGMKRYIDSVFDDEVRSWDEKMALISGIRCTVMWLCPSKVEKEVFRYIEEKLVEERLKEKWSVPK